MSVLDIDKCPQTAKKDKKLPLHRKNCKLFPWEMILYSPCSLTLQVQWTYSKQLYMGNTHPPMKTSLAWQSLSAKQSAIPPHHNSTRQFKDSICYFFIRFFCFNEPLWKLACVAGCGEAQGQHRAILLNLALQHSWPHSKQKGSQEAVTQLSQVNYSLLNP